MKINKQDIFHALIHEGELEVSGLDKNFNTYRILKFRNKTFKLTLSEEE